VHEPAQLTLPAGVQLEDIYPGHQHVDLVYFAVPEPYSAAGSAVDERLALTDQVGWHPPELVAELGGSAEIEAWSRRAVEEVGRALREL
jgi:hypothetical protein